MRFTLRMYKVANQLNVVEDNSTFMKTSGFKSIKGNHVGCTDDNSAPPHSCYLFRVIKNHTAFLEQYFFREHVESF